MILAETKDIAKLGLPILIGQIIQAIFGQIDIIMTGRYSSIDLVAVAVASNLWFILLIFGLGLLGTVTPTISNNLGAKREHKVKRVFQQGFWYTMFLAGILTTIIIFTALFIVPVFEIQGIRIAQSYMLFLSLGVIPIMLFNLMRSTCDGLSDTKVSMMIYFVGLIANIFFNYSFIYGNFGMPKLGGAGSGLATSIVYFLMTAIFIIYVYKSKKYRILKLFSNFEKPDLRYIKKLFRMSLSFATSLFLAVSFFALSGLIIPIYIDEPSMAAHQIMSSIVNLIFTFSFSLSITNSIKTSFFYGARKLKAIKYNFLIMMILNITFYSIIVVPLYLFSKQIIFFYTDDYKIASIVEHIFIFGLIIEGFDIIRIQCIGTIRGLKDIDFMLKGNLISYWIIGVPLSFSCLYFNILDSQIASLWFGFGLTFIFSNVIYSSRLIYKYNQIKLMPYFRI